MSLQLLAVTTESKSTSFSGFYQISLRPILRHFTQTQVRALPSRTLNKAKLARLTVQQAAERPNASDYDIAIAERADRESQTYALLSIAESLVELSRVLRQVNEHGLRATTPSA